MFAAEQIYNRPLSKKRQLLWVQREDYYMVMPMI